MFTSVALLAFFLTPAPKIEATRAPEYAPQLVNDSQQTASVGPNARGAAVLRAQVLLDRANFSPGEIDGVYGRNLEQAIRAFQDFSRLASTGIVDEETWRALNVDSAPVLLEYTVTPADAAGPFLPIPRHLPQQAKLKALGYRSMTERLAETFHVSEALLRAINPGASFKPEGEALWVPNVITATPRAAARILVDKSDLRVTAVDESGFLIASYPASVGSEHDPLPVGEWLVTGIHENPSFYYNPALFWDAAPGHGKSKIAPGPNNPVGVVWIDLSKEHYGIHGTPAPSSVGHAQSHGCVRLTNWDAAELAHMIAKKTPVTFQE